MRMPQTEEVDGQTTHSGSVMIPVALAEARTYPTFPPRSSRLRFGHIEVVTADDAAIEQKHGNIEAMAALEDGVAVDVDNVDGR